MSESLGSGWESVGISVMRFEGLDGLMEGYVDYA